MGHENLMTSWVAPEPLRVAGPLAVLRERYARGEIGHDEFDRYLDRLIRTEPGQQPGHGGGRD